MRTWWMNCGAIFTLAVTLTGCTSAPQPVALAGRVNGSNAALKYADLQLINSKADLEKFGCKDLCKQPIDFEHNSLLVVTLGTQPTAGYWTRIAAVERQGDTLLVQVLTNRPGPHQNVAQEATNPYDAVLIAKVTDVKLRAEPTDLMAMTPPADALLPTLIGVTAPKPAAKP